MCNENFREPRERVLMKNIATAGVLIELLNIDSAVVEKLVEEKYGRKKGLRESNQKALRLGADYVRENFACPLPFHLKTMDGNSGKILIDGNTAAALGCVYAGATVAAWYPITPSTSTMDAFKVFCERYRKDKVTGESNYLILQAEDELAAIGMVIGASWNGARAFTSTAGPGISLMNELLGLAYYAEIPVVVIDVQRVGPSTGMPTRTQQGDVLECAYASHGDTKHILLFPANPAECFELAAKSFDLAERFQTPVFMLTDLDIGMNDWVTPKLAWDDSYRPDRGRVLSSAEIDALPKFFRYMPENGSNVAAAHAARSQLKRRLLHARLRPHQVWRLHRNARRLSGGDGSPAAQAQGSGRIRAGPGDREAQGRAYGYHHHRADATPLSVKPSISSRSRASPMDYMRIRGFPFDEPVEAFIAGARLLLRGRAESRCPAALAAHSGNVRRQRRSCGPS